MHSSQDTHDAGIRDVQWRVITTSGTQFACSVHVIGARIEVRLTKEHERSVCTRIVNTHDAATSVARSWLRAVLENEDPTALSANVREEVIH